MAKAKDFRTAPFSSQRVDACGKDIGRRLYWKLYATENLIRIIVHSILTVQIQTNWWPVAADPKLQKRVKSFRATYAHKPSYSTPGNHDIYYTYLSDLGEIMRANSNLIAPVIPAVDQWVARIEEIRLPRNIVGHMNWPNAVDRNRIDGFYREVQALMQHLQATGLVTSIP